jgi:hypothetical protein
MFHPKTPEKGFRISKMRAGKSPMPLSPKEMPQSGSNWLISNGTDFNTRNPTHDSIMKASPQDQIKLTRIQDFVSKASWDKQSSQRVYTYNSNSNRKTNSTVSKKINDFSKMIKSPVIDVT